MYLKNNDPVSLSEAQLCCQKYLLYYEILIINTNDDFIKNIILLDKLLVIFNNNFDSYQTMILYFIKI